MHAGRRVADRQTEEAPRSSPSIVSRSVARLPRRRRANASAHPDPREPPRAPRGARPQRARTPRCRSSARRSRPLFSGVRLAPCARSPALHPSGAPVGAEGSLGVPPRRAACRRRAATARRGASRAPPPTASDSAEDWEALFANLKPQAPKLPHYKVAILEEALARGRRQVPIRELSADLDMPREDVLAWLKANKDRQPELAAKYPPKPGARRHRQAQRPPRRSRLRQRSRRKSRRDDDDFEDDDAYDPQTSYLRNARQQAHVPKGMPAYKGFTKKRLGANNGATLEKVYAHDRYPDGLDGGFGAPRDEAPRGARSSPGSRRNARRRRRRRTRGAGTVRGHARGRRARGRGWILRSPRRARARGRRREIRRDARGSRRLRGAKLRSTRFHLGMDPRWGMKPNEDVTTSML